MHYKLICIDMDGTLFNSSKEISQRNKEAIRKAQEAGIKVVIASGRMYNFAVHHMDFLGITTPVITANGAYVKERENDKVIYKKTLGSQNALESLRVFEKYNVSPNFFSPDSIIAKKGSRLLGIYEKANESLSEDTRIKIYSVDKDEDWERLLIEHDMDILKWIAVEEDLNKLEKLKKELSAIEGIELTSSGFNNVEANSKGVSKGRAVEIIASLYSISREEIICIGDSDNDISMIEFAGLGVAMANGKDNVKALADYVTDSNDEDGVAKVIEKFALMNK